MKLRRILYWTGMTMMVAMAFFDGPISWLLFTFGFVLSLALASSEPE